MTKYWIVVGDSHEGPFTAEELLEKNVPADTYAWHPGLKVWTQIKDIPELRDLFAEEEIDVKEDVPENFEAADTAPMESECPPQSPPPPPPANYGEPVEPAQNMSYTSDAYSELPEVPEPKCPPSYLAWSIITTLLFCLPFGIVAIIFSAKVNGQWSRGMYDQAKRSSELAAWFSNISFVAGLIWIPFSAFITMII